MFQSSESITIEAAVQMYLADRTHYYDSGDGPTREVQNLRSGLKPLVSSVGSRLLIQLDAPTLAQLRDQWAHEGKVIRSTINKRIQYVTRLVKWCIERGFSKPEQLIALTSVEKVKRGRYGARDRDPVRPAVISDVETVLKDDYLADPIRDMMEMIQLTGMRPGEARMMKASELTTIEVEGKTVIRYIPKMHKTSYLGKRRRIFLVGRAHKLTVERISTLVGLNLFAPESEGYLFSVDGHGEKPYATNSIHQAVRRACDRAGVNRWTPNQLRHGYATETRSKGIQLELIADLLGHADPRTTLIYAEPDDTAALNAAIKLAI